MDNLKGGVIARLRRLAPLVVPVTMQSTVTGEEVIDAMEADSGIKLTEMRVDGGITNNKLCMQLQSDIMAIDVVKPVITETTALGAAFAAGLAVGVWESTSQIKKIWKRESTWNCKSDANWRSHGYQKWQDAIKRTYDLA